MNRSSCRRTAPFEVLAVSPAGFPGSGVALAATSAGFSGGVSLESLPIDTVRSVLADLSSKVPAYTLSFAERSATFTEWIADPAQQPGLVRVILTGPFTSGLASQVACLKCRDLQVFIECVNAAEAKAAVDAGADGVIAKGHEGAGRVGEETTFILLQRLLPLVQVPVLARGGVGLHTAAACLTAGAAGVVLDWQLALADESGLPQVVKDKIARMDGSETAILGQGCAAQYRAYSRPGEKAFHDLRSFEEAEGLAAANLPELETRWCDLVHERVSRQELVLVSQDACFATPLTAECRTVAAICKAVQREAFRQLRVAARKDVLQAGGPMAASHGTQYPILQGPMTRVSDRADFARAVAADGALPFIALALMRGAQVDKLLAETKDKLGSMPWGVGILGFVPKELRDEQLAEVRKYKPPFMIIAGGRPDMAKQLEAEGAATYLHVPSPELLRNFLEQGARRVIFEGRECGGHVGPRSSFVLWEQMVRVILAHLRGGKANKPEEYHFVFAGGIHDARSAAMVSAITAPLAERGVRVGVLLGTGYLFTREAVETGAIAPAFQTEATLCEQTVLVESGVGHATRCADTPFRRLFADEKHRMLKERRSKEEIREKLEGLNLGRLRIASKGIDRQNGPDGKAIYRQLDEETQRREGMYMIGQVAALRKEVIGVAELHADVSRAGKILQARIDELSASVMAGLSNHRAADVAIVGFSSVFPKAGNWETYWQNILHKRNAITVIPKERWDIDIYFDSDRRAKDKIYSKWGGFIDEFVFDPVKFGMPPASLPSIEPMQLVMLEMVERALADAGYSERLYNKAETACIVGTGGGIAERGQAYGFRSMLPHFVDRAGGTLADSAELIGKLGDNLPEWTEDSFAGLLLNVVSGRVSNRFDFGATNYIVDAACATALAALRNAVTELETRSSDVVVAASADMMQTAFGYMCFAKTQALSPTGQPRTFDETADGIVISEGMVVAILKRLDDAVMDGDRIYAVIKSVGASSDGKDKGLTAPRPIGQMRALDRAYRKAEIDPATVGLIEAHGTGTVVGDRTEAESLITYFGQKGAARQSVALGSVKSMIGHTKCSAGFAGLIKAALALHYKVLPPTIGVTKPNSKAKFEESPLYINTEPRPWLERLDGEPRRAGVSAFGFGGTNFHTVLEEFTDSNVGGEDPLPLQEWPAELFLFRAGEPAQIAGVIDEIASALAGGSRPELSDLAATVYWTSGRTAGSWCLAVVAESLDDLRGKLQSAREVVLTGKPHRDPRGVFFADSSTGGNSKVAFLFPGQGSQSPNMLRDLAVAFPVVRRTFEEANSALGAQLGKSLGELIFPPPEFRDEDRLANENALKATNVAQPALGAANLAIFRLLESLGITPDMAAGHSYGEFAALCAAGAMTLEELIRISELRGRCIIESAQGELGTMAAIEAGEVEVADVVRDLPGVCIANLNSPRQTVISGTEKGVGEALSRLMREGINGKRLPVACAFHSDLVAGARGPLAEGLAAVQMRAPRFPVYSNNTAHPYGPDPAAIRQSLTDHLTQPVRFADELVAMYDAGARVFIECGPGKVMTGLAGRTFPEREFVAVTLDQAGRNGLVQLAHALAQLATAGVRFFGARLWQGRTKTFVSLQALLAASKPASLNGTAWVIRDGQALAPAEHRKTQSTAVRRGNEGGRNSGKTVLLQKPEGEPTPAAAIQREVRMENHNDNQFVRRAAATNGVPPEIVQPAMPLQGSVLEQAVQGHHRLMSRFLDTHRNVMMALLRQGVPVEAAIGAEVANYAPTAPTPMQAPLAPVAPAAPSLQAAPAVSAPVPVSMPAVMATTPPPAPVAASAPAAPVSMATPSVAAAPSVPALTREAIAAKLTELVSQRTGYPPEMLGLDLDLEADLGVDSIKRVEIFGALQSASLLSGSAIEGEIEALSQLKTLRAIIDWVESKAAELAGAESVSSPPQKQLGAVAIEATRMLVQVAEAPISEDPRLPFVQAVLITRDGYGVAQLIANKLKEAGINSAIIEDVEGAKEARAALGPVSSLIHLSPLSQSSGEDMLALESRVRRDLHPLYLLVRQFARELRDSKDATIMTATRLGGAFGFGEGAFEFAPGSGSVAGFLKTVAREWPEVNTRAVDFDQHATAEEMAERLFIEFCNRDGRVEVGYRNGVRRTLRSVKAPLAAKSNGFNLERQAVILVTGGARGITAEIALELAQAFPSRFVLVGRSALPSEQEPADLKEATTDKAIKGIIIDRMNTSGQRPTPALVEGAFRRAKQDREIRATLAGLRQAGSEWEYHAVDVSDRAAFGELIDRLYETYGRIDGVVHGAGVIEDKLIEDKTPESFDRVLAPKIVGAETLARKLRPDNLKFLAFFSSVSARYGNRGQCDYAAANEVLNKLAGYLNHRWPGRVVSFDWGPWKTEGGMVSAQLAERFAKAGVEMIAPPEGRRAFLNELRYGNKTDYEVVFGGPLNTEQQTPRLASATMPAPSLPAEMVVRTSTSNDLYLLDHVIDGHPVMPMAMVLDIFASAAAKLQSQPVASVLNVSVLKGITYPGQGGDLTFRLRLDPATDGAVQASLTSEDAKIGHYRATVEFGRPVAPKKQPLTLIEPQGLSVPIDEAYKRWMFHGPLFAGIVAVEALGRNGVIATLRASRPADLFADRRAGFWAIDPVLVDSSLQLILLWGRVYLDQMVLPSRLRAFRRYHEENIDGEVRCELEVNHQPGNPNLRCQLNFFDRSGTLVASMEDMEATASKALNRLVKSTVAGGTA